MQKEGRHIQLLKGDNMRKITAALLVVGVAMALVPVASALGVRPIGMGGAFVGLADDANAVWANEAGLMTLDGSEMNVALRIYGSEAGDSEFLPEPEYLAATYAAPLNDMWAWGVGLLWQGDWGFTLKPGVGYALMDNVLLGAGLSYIDPGDFGDDETISLDVSALWMINDMWCAGVRVDSLWDVSTPEGTEDGVLENTDLTPGVSFMPTDQWTLVLDINDLLEEQAVDMSFSVGAEYITLDEIWALRFGWADIGADDIDTYRFGVGYCPSEAVEWGYALSIMVEDTDFDYWDHYVGFSYKF
jgi:long-subunit fatty acid transport protein